MPPPRPPARSLPNATIMGVAPASGASEWSEIPSGTSDVVPSEMSRSIPGVALGLSEPLPTSDDEPLSVPPPEAKPDPYIGVTIDGRYKIESQLGEGGMGVVYAGRHKVINKRVAIKVLRADLSRDSEMTERFLQEAQAASSIGHPHIVDVSDFGTLPDGSAYFVMEFLEGRSLSDVLKETKPLPLARITHIARQVADALAAAHAQGIVHRDLKPDNIFLVSRGSEKDYVKILDFGIAKVATSSNTKLTRAGTVFGTPHYMSPEQAAGAPVDHRTDLYALGVILYEMTSGKVPFDADNYMGILTQHMYKAPVPIRAIVPPVAENVPPGLEAVILKTLSKKPEQRYTGMPELVEDLDRLDKGAMPLAVSEMIARSGSFNVPADYFASSPVMSDVMPATPPRGRAKWPLIAGVAGVVVAVGLVVAIMSAGSNSKAQQQASATAKPAPETPPAVSTAAVVTPVADPPKVTGKPVVVIAQPIDAEVWKGEENLGKVPVTVQVPDGEKIAIEVRRDGFASQSVTIDGSRGREEVKLLRALKVVAGKGGAAAPAAAGGGAGAAAPPPPSKPPPKKGGGDVVDPWAK